MSAIPYRVSTQISAHVPFPSQFYEAVWETLIGMDGLGLCLQFWFAGEKKSREKLSPKVKKKKEKDDPLPNPQAAYCVLKHVIFRTMQFRKPLEFIRVWEIIEGMPTIGIAGAPFQERTVKYALKYLVKIGALLKINLPKTRAVTSLFGLNIPIFLLCLDAGWKQAIQDLTDRYDEDNYDEESGHRAKSIKSLRAQKLLSILIQYLDEFIPLFKYIKKVKGPITNLELFYSRVQELQPHGMRRSDFDDELKEGIRNARIRAIGRK